MNRFYSAIWLFALVSALNVKDIRAQTDTLSYELEGAGLTSAVNKSGLKAGTGNRLDMDSELIRSLPTTLGIPDPLNSLKFLPGVQTLSEYNSGIHICGGEDSHNLISAGGIPVFGAKHMLGLFSVFNPYHYSGMSFSKTSGMSSDRMGGVIDMALPDTISRKVAGEASLGMPAFQGSLKFRMGRKAWASISARQSFMNMIYGRWMKLDDSPFKYDFGDYNATFDFIPSGTDRVTLDLYFSRDKASVTKKSFDAAIRMSWGNALTAVHWKHKAEKWELSNSWFCSGFMSTLRLDQESINLRLPTHIGAAGWNGVFKYLGLTAGANLTLYDVKPQTPYVTSDYNTGSPTEERQKGLDASVSAEYSILLPWSVELKAGFKGGLFRDPEKKLHPYISPRLSITYNAYQSGRISLYAGFGNQFLFQTGMSNAGLPVEFWFLSGKHSSPQSCIQANLDYSVDLFKGGFVLSCGIYASRLFNQAEYFGTLYDFISASYELDEHLLKGKGTNYGGSILFQKVSGRLTGWISYTFGRALRTFDNPDYPGIYPASHERIHELNAVCNCMLGRWNLSGAFVYTSGAPYTAPEHIYMSSGSIMVQYGDYNSMRMIPYMRMDISAGYGIFRKNNQHGEISLSVYNVFARKNAVMYKLTTVENRFAFSRLSFFLRVIPSISYTHRF